MSLNAVIQARKSGARPLLPEDHPPSPPASPSMVSALPPQVTIGELDVPPMRIVVLLSGTQGDTMPFIQFAHIMRERYGHVVRIATHADLRGPVEKAGLRFYPLKGNSKQMAAWGPSFSLDPVIFAKIAMNPHSIYKISVIRTMLGMGPIPKGGIG